MLKAAKLTILFSLGSWLFSSQVAVLANTASKSPEIYQKAREELPEDVYSTYRIVERIARANRIDNAPWRVVTVPEYQINAFATEANLIALYNGILDQLAGDASALACVIGHEMAHHTERHIALSPAKEAEIRAQIAEEAEAEVTAEAEDAQADATGAAVGSAVIRSGGGFLGGIGGLVGNTGGAVLENESRQRISRAQERIAEIIALKEQELNESLADNSRKYEFEADQLGYQYMARAGFEAEGCLRMLGVLGRTPGAEFDTTHPAIPKRIETLKDLMKDYPAENLAQEGEAQLAISQPLTYDLSKDGESLRINSHRGGSSADDLEQMFDR
ncbi:MAG: M48 family metallopeptidase [Xenococcus sp. MO_188.B8]|nr:M48 family metallopeptidase [Xenococcus sp. MO_188.B8]